MKFFVNFLSAFRIAVSFVMISTLMHGWMWTSLILFVLGAASDWFDGFLARKYNVCTKIGGVMDHIGDKFLVCNTLILLAILMPVWYIIAPTVILIARELYVSGLREFLGTQKIEMPVPKYRFSMGKIKTTVQMITIIAFILRFALISVITPETINATKIAVVNTIGYIGIVGIWLSLVASLWSATQYTITFIDKLKRVSAK